MKKSDPRVHLATRFSLAEASAKVHVLRSPSPSPWSAWSSAASFCGVFGPNTPGKSNFEWRDILVLKGLNPTFKEHLADLHISYVHLAIYGFM
jgi:hypothetical protein